MNITSLNQAPSFKGLYVEYEGLDKDTRRTVDKVARRLDYSKEIEELDKRNIDVFILPFRYYQGVCAETGCMGARMFISDRTNKPYILQNDKTSLDIRTIEEGKKPLDRLKMIDRNNMRRIQGALYSVLEGGAKKSSKVSKDIVKYFPYRDTGIIDTEYGVSSELRFDDENVSEDEYRECEELCKLYLEA